MCCGIKEEHRSESGGAGATRQVRHRKGGNRYGGSVK